MIVIRGESICRFLIAHCIANVYIRFHADIKPENILLVEGKCKLADFGFTKFVQETDTEERAFLAGATWKYSKPHQTINDNLIHLMYRCT